MRVFSCLVFGCILTFTLHSTASAVDAKKRHFFMPKNDYSNTYTLQRISVRASCFPTKLRAILAHIARQTGGQPMVTSGHRPRSGRSQHSRCYAADIRVPGVPERKILAAAASAPGIGGIGRYCNGMVHVDIGPKRRWVHC
ncbi:DUF882 domain-containing protein [Rhizobium sp. 18065]|uniref:YcbK family protein n=1 Tax=Rhizobium sp. 18065 TaxID=2681411 RepID=UPI00135B695B|nr:DUF882 domain-containing protein [Rhizobium sp. 18065]